MTTTHTQGKLRVGNTAYPSQHLLSDDPASPCVAGGSHKSYGAIMVAESITPENARRLAACWNVCEGFTTEQLENILMLGETMHSRFEARNAEDAVLQQKMEISLKALLEAIGLSRSICSSVQPHQTTAPQP